MPKPSTTIRLSGPMFGHHYVFDFLTPAGEIEDGVAMHFTANGSYRAALDGFEIPRCLRAYRKAARALASGEPFPENVGFRISQFGLSVDIRADFH
jgi:hypothetical protein